MTVFVGWALPADYSHPDIRVAPMMGSAHPTGNCLEAGF